MKVNKKVIEKLHVNTEMLAIEYNKGIDRYINCITTAKTVEQIMQGKKDLLEFLIHSLPLTAEHCYFCLAPWNDCDVCQYAKIHGRCDGDIEDSNTEDSKPTHRKLIDAKWKLINTIASYYQRGESYSEEKEGEK